MKVLVVNGPNLNMLGKREKDFYGSVTLDDIIEKLTSCANELGVNLDFFQSNSEGEIIDKIQQSSDFDGLILNLGAYTHTSIAIRDALLLLNKPFVEVHLSNVFQREAFRHKSYISDIAVGVIAGFKEDSYILALKGLVNILKSPANR
ncbi:MAG: type II 3-dehydroquinate dehydratase [bacterium]